MSDDSVYIYNSEGQKEWHYLQKDVYCFRLSNEEKFTETYDRNLIDTIVYWEGVTSKFNEIHFNNTASLSQKESYILELKHRSNFEIGAFALTKTPQLSYYDSKYYPTDDRILITFKNKRIENATILKFAEKHQLELIYAPPTSLPKDLNWSYTFRYKPKNKQLTTIGLTQLLMEQEQNIIKLAEPNIYSVIPLDCVTKNEMSSVFDGNYSTWHIRNTGQENIWSNQYGTNDADADICECWGEGYTGKNIKVGVVDFGGVQFSHPDFDNNKIQDAYNARDNVMVSVDFDLKENTMPQQPLFAHAMYVMGTVNAIPDNANLTIPIPPGQDAKRAIGVAYDAIVYPYINEWLTINNHPQSSIDDVARSLQKAFDDNVDIINMSFYVEINILTLKQLIDNATDNGRPDQGTRFPLGIVCVAGTGNTDQGASHFPANLDNVIGVGWSNPDDYRVTQNGTWNLFPTVGSTYTPSSATTPIYDVVAPGTLIIAASYTQTFSYDHTSDFNTQWGDNYISYGSGASVSTPIVSSIAAMIMEKNHALTWQEIRDYIRNGSDKVHANSTYLYNFNGISGYSQEMFFGRVSCYDILQPIPSNGLGVEENTLDNYLQLFDFGNNLFKVQLRNENEILHYDLFDLSGRSIQSIKERKSSIMIDLSNYSDGMYILKITDNQQKIYSIKLLK